MKVNVRVYTTDNFAYNAKFDNYDSKAFLKELNKPNLRVLGLGDSTESKNTIVMITPNEDSEESTHVLQTTTGLAEKVVIPDGEASESTNSLNAPGVLFGRVGNSIVNINYFKRFFKNDTVQSE